VDIETRGAVEGARSTPRGVVAEPPKSRESAKAAADRKRREAEERNARHRRTRELRASLSRANADAAAADRELAELTDRLADPSVYADALRVRQLVERHNALRDRVDGLAAERSRLQEELATAEADPALAPR
jgi:chromosome segregation ATPase